ncbi:SitI3 family protein [Actinoplanes sp. NPDC049548]|uniref:SitI3 family protein n=1 Tax=Actinoplanes sp. NPDC049548 TaxID=3155152 RepID=UPI00344461EB
MTGVVTWPPCATIRRSPITALKELKELKVIPQGMSSHCLSIKETTEAGMAIEYRLTLAGTTQFEGVAERALPDPGERPVGTGSPLSVDLFRDLGFAVFVATGRNGYLDVESDEGPWEWEPDFYVSVTFRMDKEADPQWKVANMLTVVRRVLDTGSEDAVLVLNGDYVLLTRFGGELVKHRREGWWTSYAAADSIIPG